MADGNGQNIEVLCITSACHVFADVRIAVCISQQNNITGLGLARAVELHKMARPESRGHCFVPDSESEAVR